MMMVMMMMMMMSWWRLWERLLSSPGSIERSCVSIKGPYPLEARLCLFECILPLPRNKGSNRWILLEPAYPGFHCSSLMFFKGRDAQRFSIMRQLKRTAGTHVQISTIKTFLFYPLLLDNQTSHFGLALMDYGGPRRKQLLNRDTESRGQAGPPILENVIFFIILPSFLCIH